MKTKLNLESTGTPFNTLEKIVTRDHAEQNSDSSVIIRTRGSEKETVRKWTEKKYKSKHIADALMEVAYMNEEWEWYKKYNYTKTKCLESFVTGDGKAFGHYCKKPWCPICLAIRKSIHIHQYYPIIKEWERPTFVTLTAQAQNHRDLSMWVDLLFDKLNRILEKLEMRRYRSGSEKFRCLICIECCFNPEKNWYNPHFHIVTSNYPEGRELREEWLKAFPTKLAHPVAQYIDPGRDKLKNLVEVIKYGAKILTDAETTNKGKRERLPYIYASALHEINKVFHGRKLIRKRGFKLIKNEDEIKELVIQDLQSWSYDDFVRTWVNETTGELLTAPYIPDQNLVSIYENNLDYKSR